VVIACYNDGATLPEALDSLEEQEPCEIVVVDDGSDDPHTLQVLDELQTGGLHVVRQENSGPSAARMAGVRATTARYITAVDADDAQAPGAIARLADALDADRELMLVWGYVETFGEVKSMRQLAPSLDPWLITYVNEVPAGSMMRREALLATGGWQLEGGYEDWDLWMAFAERGWKGRRLPFLNGYYRVRGGERVQARAVARHASLMAAMRNRHAELYACRGSNWRSSKAPLRAKLLLPVVARLPFASEHTRHRLSHLVCHPLHLLRVHRQSAKSA
jgi:glycosyltransferase involved in cell wall biosynthesis